MKIRHISSHNLGHAKGNYFYPSIWPFRDEFGCLHIGGWFLFFNLKWIRRVRDFKNWLAAASGRRATWRRPTSLRIDRRDRAPSRQVTQFLPALSTLLAGRGKVHGNVAASRP